MLLCKLINYAWHRKTCIAQIETDFLNMPELVVVPRYALRRGDALIFVGPAHDHTLIELRDSFSKYFLPRRLTLGNK